MSVFVDGRQVGPDARCQEIAVFEKRCLRDAGHDGHHDWSSLGDSVSRSPEPSTVEAQDARRCRCGASFDPETGVCNRTGILANHCDAMPLVGAKTHREVLAEVLVEFDAWYHHRTPITRSHNWDAFLDAIHRARAALAGRSSLRAPPEALTVAESDVIRREIREGTPDTPARIATIRSADEVFGKRSPDTLDEQAFYELMQAYRHAPQLSVVATFEAVKAYVRAGRTSGTESP